MGWRAIAAAAIPRRFLEARRFDLVPDVRPAGAGSSEGHPVYLLTDTSPRRTLNARQQTLFITHRSFGFRFMTRQLLKISYTDRKQIRLP